MSRIISLFILVALAAACVTNHQPRTEAKGNALVLSDDGGGPRFTYFIHNGRILMLRESDAYFSPADRREFRIVDKVTERERTLVERWSGMPADTVGTDPSFACWEFKDGIRQETHVFFEPNKNERLREIADELKNKVTRGRKLQAAPAEFRPFLGEELRQLIEVPKGFARLPSPVAWSGVGALIRSWPPASYNSVLSREVLQGETPKRNIIRPTRLLLTGKNLLGIEALNLFVSLEMPELVDLARADGFDEVEVTFTEPFIETIGKPELKRCLEEYRREMGKSAVEEFTQSLVVTKAFGVSDIRLSFRKNGAAYPLTKLKAASKDKWIWSEAADSLTVPMTVYFGYRPERVAEYCGRSVR